MYIRLCPLITAVVYERCFACDRLLCVERLRRYLAAPVEELVERIFQALKGAAE